MSNKLLEVKIVSPEKVVYNDKAASVTVPGTKGAFQILIDHTPIFSTTEIGEVKVTDEKDQDKYFAVSTGYVEVSGNVVSVVVDIAIDADSISENETISNIEKMKAELALASKTEKENLLNKIKFEEAKLKVLSLK